MKIQEFLKLAGQPDRTNYFVVCPDDLGLDLLLQGALAATTAAEDLYFYDAEGVTKDKAREIEKESRTGARGGSELNVFYLYSLQKLPTDSVGPLLKAAEDAKSSRFIFQAQSTPRKLHTLMSRSAVARLPFLTKAAVLANIQKLQLDAKAVDELGLYDGTLSGAKKALGMKEQLTIIKRELDAGMKGLPALFKDVKDSKNPSLLDSAALEPAIMPRLTEAERRFWNRNPSKERRKMIIFRVLMRA